MENNSFCLFEALHHFPSQNATTQTDRLPSPLSGYSRLFSIPNQRCKSSQKNTISLICCFRNKRDRPAAFRFSPKARYAHFSPKCYFVRLDGFLSFPSPKYVQLGIPQLNLIPYAEYFVLQKTSVCNKMMNC